MNTYPLLLQYPSLVFAYPFFWLLWINILLQSNAQARCPSVSVVLYTQVQVDAFLASSTNFSGSVQLQTGSTIPNLNRIKNLQSVSGDLSVDSTQLISLAGLTIQLDSSQQLVEWQYARRPVWDELRWEQAYHPA